MIVQVDGLNLLPGAGELLSQCVDDLDKEGDASYSWCFMQDVDPSETWLQILQSLWKPSPIDVGHAPWHHCVKNRTPTAPLAQLSHDDAHELWNNYNPRDPGTLHVLAPCCQNPRAMFQPWMQERGGWSVSYSNGRTHGLRAIASHGMVI